MTDTAKQKPVKTLRDGRISASVWENESEKGKYHAVTFSRSFNDSDGQIKNSTSFTGIELLKLSRLAAQAYDEIALLKAETAEGRAETATENSEEAS